MRRIKAIGFDMDYTLVRYNTENFERLAYYSMIDKLIENKGYPAELRELKFDFKKMIQGLVINKNNGHILKLSLSGKVKTCYFGNKKMDFFSMQDVYGARELDLRDPDMVSLDTNFSLAKGILFADIVEYFKDLPHIPSYAEIADDLQAMLDRCHGDGTLKDEVAKNIAEYIIQDPELPRLMETYKKYGKKLIVITNSGFPYSKLLMEYAFDPFLKDHKSWLDLFDMVITFSCKPRFFTDKVGYLKVDPETGLMTNYFDKLETGVFQGGNAAKLQKDLDLSPDEILYLGDHIYGDVVAIKKTFNWRTAMVFDPLIEELESIEKARPIQREIDADMAIKRGLERELNEMYAKRIEQNIKMDKDEKDDLFTKIDDLNATISKNIERYQEHFNPYWGEQMRSGLEETRLAGQIEKYACVYMPTVTDLLRNSPRTYFIPERRILPHEK